MWRCGRVSVDLSRTAVMGVLNVTPDSFSDGGLWLDPEAAVKHGMDMVAAGAGVIDVGGESTRPGASPVPEDEERRRVLPVIAALADAVDVPISIDTRKSAVARAALEAGATIVNDTTGEESDGSLDAVAAEAGAGYVVMHSRGTPQTMRAETDYDDVVDFVARWLANRTSMLKGRGVDKDAIVVDPGIGFAKTPAQNLVLLRDLRRIVDGGFPVLIGVSRKSFIGALLGLPEDRRLEGSLAAACWAVAEGARIVRVHDVAETVNAVRVTEAIRATGKER